MSLKLHAGQLGHAGLDCQGLPFFDGPNSHVYSTLKGKAVAETLLTVKRLQRSRLSPVALFHLSDEPEELEFQPGAKTKPDTSLSPRQPWSMALPYA
jgi:hypothetical protein